MGLFLNIFGSVLLVLAGILVAISFFKEKTAMVEPKKIKFKNWIYIALLSIALRWTLYYIAYLNIGTNVSFFEHLYNLFIKAGDTPHYLHIAEQGYTSIGDKANLIVFYPLYPLLIKIFNIFFNNYFVSAIFVSNISFMLSTCMFYELLRLDFDDEKSISGLMLMAIAPFSMFYSAIYTESVFVLCTTLTLYFMQTKKHVLMALFGFLACLSRTQGVILFVCALIPVLSDLIKDRKVNVKQIICAIIIPLGFVVYLSINKVLFDDWFKYLEFQSAPPWYNTAQWFGKTLTYSYDMALDHKSLASIIYWPQLIFFFIGTLSIYYGLYKKVRTEYLVYTGAYIYMCYTHGWLISGSRYMCVCLPLFIIFTSTKNKYIRYGIVILSLILCVIYTNLWFKGYSIM